MRYTRTGEFIRHVEDKSNVYNFYLQVFTNKKFTTDGD